MHANTLLFARVFQGGLVEAARPMSDSLTARAAAAFAETEFLPPSEFDAEQTTAIAMGMAEVENERWRVRRVRRRTSGFGRRRSYSPNSFRPGAVAV